MHRFPVFLHDRFPADKGRDQGRGLKRLVMRIRRAFHPFPNASLPAVLVKETVTGGAAQAQIVKAQERPPQLLGFATRRTSNVIESSGPAQEMTVDPASAFDGRLTEAQNFKVGSVGAHPLGCERIRVAFPWVARAVYPLHPG